MKRLVLILALGPLTSSLGVASMELYLAHGPRFRIKELKTRPSDVTLLYETSDGQEMEVQHQACAPGRVRVLLQSYRADPHAIEQGVRRDWLGRAVGGRVVIRWAGREGAGGQGVRVLLTEGGDYWLVYAPSIALAREFEGSFEFRYAMSNHRMHPTADTGALK